MLFSSMLVFVVVFSSTIFSAQLEKKLTTTPIDSVSTIVTTSPVESVKPSQETLTSTTTKTTTSLTSLKPAQAKNVQEIKEAPTTAGAPEKLTSTDSQKESKALQEKKDMQKDEKEPAKAPEKKEAEVDPKKSEAKPVAPVKKPEPVRSTEVLDTIDIEEGGNWLIKRQIFEDTFKLIDEMDQVNTKIRDMRMTFYKLRNNIDKQVALFVKDIGYSLGKLDQMATTILNLIEQERKKEGDLSDRERSVVISVENVEEKVKQIQDAVQEIINLDDQIDSEILKSLEDRINESAGYRQQGWKNLQSIKQILNDEKAQNLYNKTKALYETMQNILSWLQSKLLPYFNKTVQSINNDISLIKNDLQELQSRGFDIQQEMLKIEKQQEDVQQQRMKEEIQEQVEHALEKSKESEQGFFANIFSWIANLFQRSPKKSS